MTIIDYKCSKVLSCFSRVKSVFIEGGAYGTNWGLVMAASAIIIVPLLVLFALTEKWFVNGIGGETGVKG